MAGLRNARSDTVAVVEPAISPATAAETRSSSSPAALRVKVRPRMRFRCHTSIDKRDDALGHRKGFAGTGTGNHQYVSIDWRIDDGGLFRTGSERAHACLVSKIVSIWPAQAGQTFFIRQNPIWVSCGWASMMADLLAAAA